MKAKVLLAVLGLLAILAVFLPLYRYTETRRFQEDEHIFVRRGVFADYYLAGKFFDPIWQSFDSYDVPKLGELFYGVVLRLYSGKTTYGYLSSVSNFIHPIDSPDYYWFVEYSRSHCCSIQDLPLEIQERMTPILIARKFAVFTALLSLVNLFAIGWRAKNWLFGVLIVCILGQNILFKDSMTTAMGDGLLLFLSLLYVGVIGLFFTAFQHQQRRRYIVFFITASIATGLATATKLNGVINLFHFLIMSQLFLGWLKNPFRVLKYQFSFVIIAYVTFFILNPFLWTNPLRNTMFMNITRQVTIEKQQEFSQKNGLAMTTLSKRLTTTYQRTLANNGYYSNFSMSQASLPVGVVIFLLGIYFALTAARRQYAKDAVSPLTTELNSFSAWIILWMVITTVLIPLDWDHYYLPIVLGVSVTQSYAISEVARKLLACLPESFKVIPHQK